MAPGRPFRWRARCSAFRAGVVGDSSRSAICLTVRDARRWWRTVAAVWCRSAASASATTFGQARFPGNWAVPAGGVADFRVVGLSRSAEGPVSRISGVPSAGRPRSPGESGPASGAGGVRCRPWVDGRGPISRGAGPSLRMGALVARLSDGSEQRMPQTCPAWDAHRSLRAVRDRR